MSHKSGHFGDLFLGGEVFDDELNKKCFHLNLLEFLFNLHTQEIIFNRGEKNFVIQILCLK